MHKLHKWILVLKLTATGSNPILPSSSRGACLLLLLSVHMWETVARPTRISNMKCILLDELFSYEIKYEIKNYLVQ